MINSLQEKYFNIYHVDIILWENRMSLQESKKTSMKEFFHIKTFEPNYSFLGYKSLKIKKEREKWQKDGDICMNWVKTKIPMYYNQFLYR